MMSRAFLLAAVLAVVSGESDHIRAMNAGKSGTCPIGWQLIEAEGKCKKDPSDAGSASCSLANNGCMQECAQQWFEIFGTIPEVGGASGGTGGFTSKLNAGHAAPISTYHDMDGWVDIPKSRFRRFEEFFRYIPVVIPGYATGPQYDIVWRCPTGAYIHANPSFQGCDVFLFQYHCPPCTFNHGNLGAKLLSHDKADFRIGTCAPTFILDYSDTTAQEHKFAAYMAEMAADDEIRVRTDARTDFIFWGNVGTSVICTGKLDEATCLASPQSCVWDGDSCQPRQCFTSNTSPFWGGSPRCTYCVDKEDHLLPTIV